MANLRFACSDLFLIRSPSHAPNLIAAILNRFTNVLKKKDEKKPLIVESCSIFWHLFDVAPPTQLLQTTIPPLLQNIRNEKDGRMA